MKCKCGTDARKAQSGFTTTIDIWWCDTCGDEAVITDCPGWIGQISNDYDEWCAEIDRGIRGQFAIPNEKLNNNIGSFAIPSEKLNKNNGGYDEKDKHKYWNWRRTATVDRKRSDTEWVKIVPGNIKESWREKWFEKSWDARKEWIKDYRNGSIGRAS